MESPNSLQDWENGDTRKDLSPPDFLVSKQPFSSNYFTTRTPNRIYSTVLSVVITNLNRARTEQIKGYENQQVQQQEKVYIDKLVTKHSSKLQTDVP